MSSLNAIIDGEVSIPRRRDLIVDGFEYRKLSFVKDGYAVRYKLLRNGKRQILNVVLPGDIVGIPASFLDRAAYSVTAVTDVTMTVCALDAYVQPLLSASAIRPGFELDRRSGSNDLRRAYHRRRPPHAH